MDNEKDFRKMPKCQLLAKICSGRLCSQCPFIDVPRCWNLPRETIIDAYCKLFEVFEVTDKEWTNLISGE